MPQPVINPPGPLTVDGKDFTDSAYLDGKAIYRDFAVTNAVDVVWAVDGGTLSNILARSVRWTAPNISGTYHLTATAAGQPVTTIVITVEAVLPTFWEWKTPIEAKKKTLTFEAVDGPDQTRTLSGTREFYKLGADDSSYAEGVEMKAFQEAHHPVKKFWLLDPVQRRKAKFNTDSTFSFAYNDQDSWQWNFSVKQAWPYTWVTY
jgi:hypothetical protein